ncbi:MAG TPA: hypothetical protein VGF53_17620 [Pseudolabrys sp.]|jgi:hypothetical protein
MRRPSPGVRTGFCRFCRASLAIMPMRRSVNVFFGAVFAALVSGCAMSEDPMASFLVAPGGYTLFSCDDIARTRTGVLARQKQLEELMAKAGTDAAGRIIAETTYGTEYAATRGQLRSLQAAAAERNCNVPAAGTPGAPPSTPKAR